MALLSPTDHRWGVPTTEVLTLVEDYLSDAATRTHERLDDVLGVAVTTSGENGRPLTAGASTALAAEVDQLQYAIGRGPCLAALDGRGEIYVPDLGTDARWQPYGRRAVALGARCSLSVPVADGRPGVLGVVKVYAGRADALDAEQRRTVRELALEVAGGVGLAGRLVSTALELDDRTEAMDTRRTIDLATGIVMARAACSPETAFGLLRAESQNHDTKLSDVAADLVRRTAAPEDARSSTAAPFSRRGEVPGRGR